MLGALIGTAMLLATVAQPKDEVMGQPLEQTKLGSRASQKRLPADPKLPDEIRLLRKFQPRCIPQLDRSCYYVLRNARLHDVLAALPWKYHVHTQQSMVAVEEIELVNGRIIELDQGTVGRGVHVCGLMFFEKGRHMRPISGGVFNKLYKHP